VSQDFESEGLQVGKTRRLFRFSTTNSNTRISSLTVCEFFRLAVTLPDRDSKIKSLVVIAECVPVILACSLYHRYEVVTFVDAVDRWGTPTSVTALTGSGSALHMSFSRSRMRSNSF
jgi:hypothetical protein